MELLDIKTVMLLRDKAFRAIQADKDMWKLWNECKTEHDREVLLTQVIFQQTFDEAYERGYDMGRHDGALYGEDEG